MGDINQQSEQPAVEEEHIDVLVVGGGPVGKSLHNKVNICRAEWNRIDYRLPTRTKPTSTTPYTYH